VRLFWIDRVLLLVLVLVSIYAGLKFVGGTVGTSEAQSVALESPVSGVGEAGEARREGDFRTRPGSYIWIERQRLLNLPVSGVAWEALLATARMPLSRPNLSDQNDQTNVRVLAQALVYARTGVERYRQSVVAACMAAMGTEVNGRTLELGKELAAYVLAADLVGLPAQDEKQFRSWLDEVRYRRFPSGKSLVSTHERRPNNWGTFAGASRLAIAAYLDDGEEIQRAAQVFKGWLGDRQAYQGFRFRDLSWQGDARAPVGINPVGAVRRGFSVDGVLPDDQRRGGGFQWPPAKENYVYSALQGALVQAIILDRLGYPVWEWQDQALLRAFNWLYEKADYPAVGDDTWQPYVINYFYNSNFPTSKPAKSGKNVGWTDWTHERNR